MDLDWPSVARLRQGTYRLLGAALLSPSETRMQQLVQAAEYLDRSGVEMFAFASSWSALRASLREPPPLRDLRSEYLRLFVVAPQGPSCTPVESHYVSSARSGGHALLAGELERLYRRFGLEIVSDAGAAVDHISTELEAMAFLCGREAEARDELREALASELLGAQRLFLRQHLARWLPRFTERVGLAAPGGFYASITEAADAFVHHDLSLVTAAASQVRAAGGHT